MAKKEKEEIDFRTARANSLKELCAAVAQRCGDGSIESAKSAKYRPLSRFSTGCIQLDYSLGGGIPQGRVSLLTGEESSCKTRLAYGVIADCQKRSVFNNKYLWEDMPAEERVPYQAMLIDVEGSYENSWAQAIGIDTDALLLARPENQEDAGEILISSMMSGSIDLIVCDSIDSLIPQDTLDAAFDESSSFAAAAKNNSKMFRKIQAVLNKYAKEDESKVPTCVFINQVRWPIEASRNRFAPKKPIYPGGDAQKFYASVIIQLKQGAFDYADGKERQDPTKAKFYFMIDKSKVCRPKMAGNFEMAMIDHHVYKEGQIIDHGITLDWAERHGFLIHEDKGPWILYGESFPTKKAMVEKWLLDPQRYAILKRDLLAKIYPKQ